MPFGKCDQGLLFLLNTNLLQHRSQAGGSSITTIWTTFPGAMGGLATGDPGIEVLHSSP